MLLLMLFLSVLSCSDMLRHEAGISYTEVSPMPVPAASSACAVINDVAYIYGGRTEAGPSGAMYSYSPSEDTWAEMPVPPLEARSGAVAAAHGKHLYLGLGYNGGGVYRDESYPRDWWRFTPDSGEWKRLADYPSNRTAAASTFVHEDGIYVCFGFYDGFYEDVYRYDISSDEWKILETNIIGGQAETVAGEVGGRYFAGTGTNWHEFLPSENRWEKRSSTRGTGNLVSSTIFPYGNGLYMAGGREWSSTRPDGRIFHYDPAEDKWSVAGFLPAESGKENMISFVIGGVPYIGLGEDKDRLSSTLYKLTIH